MVRSALPLVFSCASGGPSGPGRAGLRLEDPPLLDALDEQALLAHLDALQAIADAHDGNRLAGTPGSEASLDWAEALWEQAGLSPWREEFPFYFWQQSAPVALSGEGVPAEPELLALKYSVGGEARGPLVPVDLTLPPGDAADSADSGCEAEDFEAMPPGAVALIQRGACSLSTKIANAAAAGAAAVILFNEGQEGRTDTLRGSVRVDEDGVPAVGASFALGEALAALAGVEVALRVEVEQGERLEENLLVDIPGQGDGIVVVGAHLDSVQFGAGINDNGTGAALVVELGRTLAARPEAAGPRMRLALWGAEEFGLWGSDAYVEARRDGELVDHVGTLTFDMVGSPNGGRFVYDGDGSAGLDGEPPPEGSGALEALFTDWFDAQGLAWEPTPFDGRSDYRAFVESGVPSGGLFTGADALASDEQAADSGGEAGEAFDPCYHQACDDRSNIDEALYLEMARAAVHAVDQIRRAPATPLGRRARRLPSSPGGGCAGHPDR